MADDDQDKDAPSLEAPSLGFGRKRRQSTAGDTPEPEKATAIPAPQRPIVAPTTQVDAEGSPPLFADELEEIPATVDDSRGEATPDDAGAATVSRAPLIAGLPAAVITGLVIGAIMVGLTAGSLQVCESVKGTSSCGNPGFLLLVAIVISMVLLGSTMLRVFRVPDPGSTSFLAVGLLSVLTLLFLVDVLANWWMIIVIPLLSALTFALSHWVTTALVEPAEHRTTPPEPDEI